MATIQRIPINSDGTVAVPSEWFVARITSVASTQSGSGSCLGYAHGWIEQSICANGFSYEDDTTGLTGTTTVQPAFALDGTKASVNDMVLMRPRSIAGSGSLVIFEFIKSGVGASVSQVVVTGITCTNGTLTVTTKTLTVPGMTVT